MLNKILWTSICCVLSMEAWSWEMWGSRKTTLLLTCPHPSFGVFFLQNTIPFLVISLPGFWKAHVAHKAGLHMPACAPAANSYCIFSVLLKQPQAMNYWVPFLFSPTLVFSFNRLKIPFVDTNYSYKLKEINLITELQKALSEEDAFVSVALWSCLLHFPCPGFNCHGLILCNIGLGHLTKDMTFYLTLSMTKTTSPATITINNL